MLYAIRRVVCGIVFVCLGLASPLSAIRTKDPGSSRDGQNTFDECDTTTDPTPFVCAGTPDTVVVTGDFTVTIKNFQWANDGSGELTGQTTILQVSVTSGTTPAHLAYLDIKGAGLSKPGFVACDFYPDSNNPPNYIFKGTVHCVDFPLVSNLDFSPLGNALQPQPVTDPDNQLVHWSFVNFDQMSTMTPTLGNTALSLDGFVNLPSDPADYLAVAYDDAGNPYCAGTLPGCPKVNPPPPATNDFIANAKVLTGTSFTDSVTASTAVNVYATPAEGPNNPGGALPSGDGTTDPSPSNCEGPGTGPIVSFSSLWYTYVPPAPGTLNLDTLTSSYDTVLSVYTKDTNQQLQEVSCNDDITSGEFQSSLSLPNLTAGTTYYIMVGEAPPAVDNEIDSTGNPIVDGSGNNIKAATPLSSDERLVLHGSFLISGPFAVLSPTSLTFGNQNVGTTSGAQNVTLSNTGTATLNITGITASGDFAVQSSTCGASLTAGSNCTISVTFTPTQTGPRSGTLSVTDNAPGSPQTGSLTGTGVAPAVMLKPTSLTFVTQVIGKPSPAQNVILTNTGTGTLTISSITVTGTNAPDFSQTNTCGTSVAPGATCTISVVFDPTGKNTRTASVSIVDNAAGSPQSILLSGLGTFVKLVPNKLKFGNQMVGTQSGVLKTGVTNTSTSTLNITSIKVTGTNKGDFSQTNNCGTSLAPGKLCTVSVTFKPTAKGARSANVSITDSGGASPQNIQLSGTGT